MTVHLDLPVVEVTEVPGSSDCVVALDKHGGEIVATSKLAVRTKRVPRAAPPVFSSVRRLQVADIYRAHGCLVVRRAQQIIGESDEAQEVLQDVFRKLLENPSLLDDVRDVRAWLYGVTTRMCLNRMRDQKNRTRLIREKVAPIETPQCSAETKVLVRQMVRSLPRELSSVFVHYYLEQMSHREIANILGCSRRQVGNLIDRAHAQLRE